MHSIISHRSVQEGRKKSDLRKTQRAKRKKNRIVFSMSLLKNGRCRAKEVFHFTRSNSDAAQINEILLL